MVFETRCKVCNSDYRDDYDSMLRDGQSCRSVSRYAEEKGESISHVSIRRHAMKHMTVEQPQSTYLKTSRIDLLINNPTYYRLFILFLTVAEGFDMLLRHLLVELGSAIKKGEPVKESLLDDIVFILGRADLIRNKIGCLVIEKCTYCIFLKVFQSESANIDTNHELLESFRKSFTTYDEGESQCQGDGCIAMKIFGQETEPKLTT